MLDDALCELLRRCAQAVLKASDQELLSIENASLLSAQQDALQDPVIIAASRRATRAGMLHWAASIYANPNQAVAVQIPQDLVNNALEAARKGARSNVFKAFRASQDAAWRYWMQIVFRHCQDPAQLHTLLEVSSVSISTFLDATLEQLAQLMQQERERHLTATPAQRHALINRLLAGDNAPVKRLSQQLGYALERQHLAVIIWSEQAECAQAALDQVARRLTELSQARAVLRTQANQSCVWLWLSETKTPLLDDLQRSFSAFSNVRIAFGNLGVALEGFRQSHQQALITQKLMANNVRPYARFAEVQLIALLDTKPLESRRFIHNTLAQLADAEPLLLKSVWVYLRAGCNASLAAEKLHTHRNTLLRRLAHAQRLLPCKLDENLLHIGAALELLLWHIDESMLTN